MAYMNGVQVPEIHGIASQKGTVVHTVLEKELNR